MNKYENLCIYKFRYGPDLMSVEEARHVLSQGIKALDPKEVVAIYETEKEVISWLIL